MNTFTVQAKYAVLVFTAVAGTVAAQPCATLGKLTSPSPAASDYFGMSVSMSFGGPNNRPLMAVGKPYEDSPAGVDTGGWSVWQYVNGSWNVAYDAWNSDGDPNERAGTLMIVRLFDNISYALVMEATRDLRPDEIAQIAGRAGRFAHVARLQPHLEAMIAALLPGAGSARLELLPGWRRQELSLADALLLARDRDLVQGHTSVGPHRADLRLELRDLPGRDGLSRGQAKLAALALLLAQAAYLAGQDGHWPVLQLDDLASELDRPHQRRVLQALHASGAQVFVTGTEPPAVLRELDLPVAMFHVEHGSVARLCA